MAKAVVTQERVFEAAEALVEQGVTPTILNVQDGVGGGSYTTVKRYLDQWKEAAEQRRAVELPEAAVTRLISLGREFWGLLDEQAGQQVEAIRRRPARRSARSRRSSTRPSWPSPVWKPNASRPRVGPPSRSRHYGKRCRLARRKPSAWPPPRPRPKNSPPASPT